MKKYTKLVANYDGGDNVESILFLNKIKFIYTKGALFIINNNNFQKNLANFRKEFIKMNKLEKGDIFELKNESDKNILIDKLTKQFFKKNPKENKFNKIRKRTYHFI